MKKLLLFALVLGFFIHLLTSCGADKKKLKTDAFVAKVDSLIDIGNYSLAQLYADSANEINQDNYNYRPSYLASNIKKLTSSAFQDSVLVAMSDEEFKDLSISKILHNDYLHDGALNDKLGRVLHNRRNDRNYLTRVFKAREAGQTLKQSDRALAKARVKKRRRTYNNNYAGANAYSAKPKTSYSRARSSYSSSQCSGTTKKGNQCRRITKDPSGYCWQHQ